MLRFRLLAWRKNSSLISDVGVVEFFKTLRRYKYEKFGTKVGVGLVR